MVHVICRTKPVARKALLSQFSLIMCGWSKFSSFDGSRSFDQHVLYSFSFPLDCSTCALISSCQVLDISTGRLRTLDETSFFVSCSMFINPLPHSRIYGCWNRNNLVLIIYWYGCKSFTWLDFLISLKVLPWYASFHWMTVWHALLRWWIWQWFYCWLWWWWCTLVWVFDTLWWGYRRWRWGIWQWILQWCWWGL